MPTEVPMAWVNGQQIPLSHAAVPAWDLGVVAGATISEMARTYRQTPFRLDRHLLGDRLPGADDRFWHILDAAVFHEPA